MTLQTQLAGEVAEQLASSCLWRDMRNCRARIPEAYDQWLKGTLAWQQVGGGGATAKEIDRVEAMFTRAIELDDTYGAAYADRARVRIARYASARMAARRTSPTRARTSRSRRSTPAARRTCWSARQLAFLVDHDLRRASG